MSTIRVSAGDYHRGKVGAHVQTGDPLYIEGDSHFVVSSQQDSACVVVPGTPEDVGKIVRSFHLASPDITPRTRSNIQPLLIISSK